METVRQLNQNLNLGFIKIGLSHATKNPRPREPSAHEHYKVCVSSFIITQKHTQKGASVQLKWTINWLVVQNIAVDIVTSLNCLRFLK